MVVHITENHDGTKSLQILERNQISDKEPIHISALKSSTHFNQLTWYAV